MNVRVWWCWRHGLAPGPSARRPRAVLCSSSVRKRSPVRAPDCLAAAAQMAWARSELLNLLCRPRHSWLPAVLPTERPPCPADTSWTRGFTWEGDTCSGVPAPGVRRRGPTFFLFFWPFLRKNLTNAPLLERFQKMDPQLGAMDSGAELRRLGATDHGA
jgi:hypothetical protein